MKETLELMLKLMDESFHYFESIIPNKPKLVHLSFGPAYRFKEKNIYQAMIQKLARLQSIVRAAHLLLRHGFVQEQAILHRAIDETNEDILFLVHAVTTGIITDLHERFLEGFWEEEIDESGKILDSQQKRLMVPRKKIYAYLAKMNGIASSHEELLRTINKAYSGFVHGASPQIMDMYGGNPAHFHTKGMLGTPRMEEHANDSWSYVYRSFISHILVAKAIGAETYVVILIKNLNEIERLVGMRD